jgi:hypothetical protein
VLILLTTIIPIGTKKYLNYHHAAEPIVSPTVPPAPPVREEELAMQCEPEFLPIAIAPHSNAAILLLSANPGFINQLNNSGTYLNWPTRDSAEVPKNSLPKMTYQCRIASLEGPVEEVLIPITIILGSKTSVENIRFPLLDKSQAPFYVVSQCDNIRGFVVPDTATLFISGEKGRREVPLLGESAIEKRSHLFMPSGIKWHEHPLCN